MAMSAVEEVFIASAHRYSSEVEVSNLLARLNANEAVVVPWDEAGGNVLRFSWGYLGVQILFYSMLAIGIVVPPIFVWIQAKEFRWLVIAASSLYLLIAILVAIVSREVITAYHKTIDKIEEYKNMQRSRLQSPAPGNNKKAESAHIDDDREAQRQSDRRLTPLEIEALAAAHEIGRSTRWRVRASRQRR